ncbi:MAG: PorV/PorQ family protein [Bacteroidetes bacterium]|nr:PorV/PorQ family protein [Bacteroidota bacterium]
MNRFAVVILVMMLMLPVPGTAQTFGKYAGEFMSIGIGGRALGMGSAYAAVVNDVTAGYWNPAGLVHMEYPQLTASHDERFGDLVAYDYAAFAFPSGMNAADPETGEMQYRAESYGISIVRLGVDGIPDTRKAWADSNGNKVYDENIRPDYSAITYFNWTDYVVYGTYARQYSEDLFVGANVKLIRRSGGEFHGTGIGFDLGVQYRLMPGLMVAANLQDATTTLVSWSTGTNELIAPTLKLGLAYALEVFNGRLMPVLGTDVRFENRRFASAGNLGPVSFDPHAGIEFDYNKLVAIRAGYNELGNLTIGAGIHLRKLDVDYSFAKFDAADQLGNTHRISLILTLEEEKYRRGAE